MNDKAALGEFEGVSKKFIAEAVETMALIDANLKIFEGEFVVISGPSGCGKSTLLSILALFDVPSAGTYRIRGQVVNTLDSDERARLRNELIGFVFQSFNLLGHLNVFQNIELPMIWRRIGRDERKHRVMNVLDQVGLSHRAKHFPSQLSGGQQQRVAVARAIAGNPTIILADEPTGNLDSKNAESIMELLQMLHKSGATLVMVTHQPEFASKATRRVELRDGRIISSAAQSRNVPLAIV
jgi:putative ABC transport system ATP-binding protein